MPAMPSAIVEIRTTYAPEVEVQLLETVHAAIVQAFKVSPVHRNVTLVVHAPHRFLGRTDCLAPERLTNVSIFVLPGRSVAAKRALYKLLVDGLELLGIPRACVLIRLHELPPENIGVRGGLPVCDVALGYPVDI
ncbi:tautomerase-like protein [Pseudorhodoferax soli]|uniref:Tautomerase-like protein n=2 Tax=Pseudorhodoferax soli TaxID=545864 RepID=A0A368XQD3_9BURK|nr:tautomerase-like protein [Pseudorhodoferax soli]